MILIQYQKSYSQNNETNLKVAYIYNFVENIDWQDGTIKDNFVIGYYGNSDDMMKSLGELANSKKIKDKNVMIIKYSSLNLIQAPYPQAIFVSEENNNDIGFVNNKINDKNVLLITDNVDNQKFVMLNFTYNLENELSFEINKKTIADHNLKILPQLLLLGGSEIDIKNLYKEKEEELKIEKERVEELRKEVEKQEAELKKQRQEVELLAKQIDQKQEELKLQTAELEKEILKSEEQKRRLALIQKKVLDKENQLDQRNKDIAKQEKVIADQTKTVEDSKNKLAELDQQIIEKQELIKNKELELAKKEEQLGIKDTKINQQQNLLIGILAVLIIILSLSFLLIRSYRTIKKAKTQIERQKNEVLEKNEELVAAEEELRQNNEELLALNDNLKEQHRIIHEKDKKYRTLFESSNDAISIINEGKFIDCNKAMVEMLNYKNKTEFLDLKPYQLSPEKQLDGRSSEEKADEVIQIAIEQGVNKFEWIHKRSDGSLFPAEVWLTAMKMKNETVIHTVIRDLSEQKAAEQIILKSKEKIEKAHKDITDSINYAKTIQEALLTKEEIIDNWLNEYFILFKPKDRVSGDFYYINKVNNFLIITAADCTGHGVPGGFLTMLGITFLHEAVKHREVTKASEILEILRSHIKDTFSSFGSQNASGLDIALCVIDTENGNMQFAGAYNPLLIIRNNELIQYKATRNPIGNYPKEKDFENNEIQLQKDDLFYIFSDGYPDQFGGESRKKFTMKRFKDLLMKNHKLSLPKQKEAIEQNLLEWQNDNEQVDDIILIGVKWDK